MINAFIKKTPTQVATKNYTENQATPLGNSRHIKCEAKRKHFYAKFK